MSKAKRIRTLAAQGLSTRQIAVQVFGTERPTEANLAYVRVVARQRDENGRSEAEITWRIKMYGSVSAFHEARNATNKDKRNTYYRERYRADPEYRRMKRLWIQRRAKRLAEAYESA